MENKFKNYNLINSICCLIYITISYLFTIWYQIKYMTFEANILSGVIFIVFNIMFIALTLYFLRFTNSNIAIIIIMIFTIINLKAYSIGPMYIFLNKLLGTESMAISALIIEAIVIIINFVLLFYSIYKLHEALYTKRKI